MSHSYPWPCSYFLKRSVEFLAHPLMVPGTRRAQSDDTSLLYRLRIYMDERQTTAYICNMFSTTHDDGLRGRGFEDGLLESWHW
jgi:hypothetical protein